MLPTVESALPELPAAEPVASEAVQAAFVSVNDFVGPNAQVVDSPGSSSDLVLQSQDGTKWSQIRYFRSAW